MIKNKQWPQTLSGSFGFNNFKLIPLSRRLGGPMIRESESASHGGLQLAAWVEARNRPSPSQWIDAGSDGAQPEERCPAPAAGLGMGRRQDMKIDP